MKTLILVLCLTSVFCVVPWPVEQCKSTNKLVEFTSATLGIVPAKGTDNDITLYGTALDHVEFLEVKCKAYLNGILVSTIDIPYEDVFDQGDPITYMYTNTFPSFTPSGKYLVNFEFYDQEKVLVGCGGIQFALKEYILQI